MHVIVAQAASAAALLRRGALRPSHGVFGLAVALHAWFRLLAARRDALRAADVLEVSLRIGSRGTVPQTNSPLIARRSPAFQCVMIWFPRFTERSRYLQHEDLSYGESGLRNHLDIWRRKDLPLDARAPVLIQIHGSAWTKGSKRGQGYPLWPTWPKSGWVCVAINYSLAPAARWPAHIIDVKRAIAWVKREIAAYGGDPDFVAVTGGSAGGHLSALAALTVNDPVFQPGFEDADTSVRAGVPLYGVYDLLDRAGDSPPEQEEFLTESSSGHRRRMRLKSGTRARRCHMFGPTRRRFSSSTEASTPSPTTSRHALSPRHFAKCRKTRWRMRNCPEPSTHST